MIAPELKQEFARKLSYCIQKVHAQTAIKTYAIGPYDNILDLPEASVPHSIGVMCRHPDGSCVKRYNKEKGTSCFYFSSLIIHPTQEGGQYFHLDSSRWFAEGYEKEGKPVGQWNYHWYKTQMTAVYDEEGKIVSAKSRQYGVLPKEAVKKLNEQFEKTRPLRKIGSHNDKSNSDPEKTHTNNVIERE